MRCSTKQEQVRCDSGLGYNALIPVDVKGHSGTSALIYFALSVKQRQCASLTASFPVSNLTKIRVRTVVRSILDDLSR